jgi:hypothetical protein
MGIYAVLIAILAPISVWSLCRERPDVDRNWGLYQTAGRRSSPSDLPSNVRVVLNRSLECPSKFVITGETPEGPGVGPIEGLDSIEFALILDVHGQRTIRFHTGNGFSGQSFEIELHQTTEGWAAAASAQVFLDFGPPFTFELPITSGRVILASMDWRGGERVAVDIEVTYSLPDAPGSYRLRFRGLVEVQTQP